MASFGQGTSLLGATANQVLGMPGPMQQSPSSMGFQPGTLPPPPPMSSPPMPQQSPQMQPMPGAQPVPSQMPQVPQQPLQPPPPQNIVGIPPQVPETMMILKALIERQKLLGEHEKSVRDTMIPPRVG